MNYRVVYGETMPAWEKTFPTLREARAFAKKHENFGDVIFSIAKVVIGERPQSLMAMIDRGDPFSDEQVRHDHRDDNTGLDDGPPLNPPRRKPEAKSAEETADIRARAWATRRAKYGARGHR